MNRRVYVYGAYMSLFLAFVWGIGIIPSYFIVKRTRTISADADAKTKRDLRGANIVARGGLVLNSIVLMLLLWSFFSTYVL